jgi:hypothetical protein
MAISNPLDPGRAAGVGSAGSFLQRFATVKTMSYDFISLLIGAIAALIGTLPVLVPALREWRHRERQDYKYSYIKIIHLTRNNGTNPPVHRAYIPRLGQYVDVFDEYNHYRLNIFPRKRPYTSTNRTSGVCDLRIVFPWRDEEELDFSDRDSGKIPSVISQTVDVESKVHFTNSINFNGLQPGNEYLAMRMEYDTREARMLVDFSSIPNCEVLVSMPTAVVRVKNHERKINVYQVATGVFMVCESKLQKDAVLRMDFRFNWPGD